MVKSYYFRHFQWYLTSCLSCISMFYWIRMNWTSAWFFFFPSDGTIQFWTHQLFVISGLPLLKIHCNNKPLMPATAEDRTSDSIEALGSGQLSQFRTWDLYFPSVCCISLSDIEKFSKGTFMGKNAERALTTFITWMHSRFIFNHIDFKNAWARQKGLWLSCFKMVIIENKTRSHMNKGRVLKRENKFRAAYE